LFDFIVNKKSTPIFRKKRTMSKYFIVRQNEKKKKEFYFIFALANTNLGDYTVGA